MSEKNPSAPVRKRTAGVLDIRNVIGLLLAVYGVILLLMGLFADPETEKTGGVNANLWAGLILLAVGIGFAVWSWLRPVVVEETPTTTGGEDRPVS